MELEKTAVVVCSSPVVVCLVVVLVCDSVVGTVKEALAVKD